MDLRALEMFVTVTDTESFTRAAQKVRVSQSAVSQQIRSLEDSLGTPLFTRHARKVTLTQAGSVLLPYARQILAKVEEARAVVSDLEGMGRGRIVIGAGGALCHHVLPSLLREFAGRFGKIDVHVISGISEQTLRRTTEGVVDIGLVLLPVDDASVVVNELGRDELVAIAPPGHAWQALSRVTPRDLTGERLVAQDRSSETFRLFERFLLEGGAFPKFAMEISDLEAVKEMVREGLGVSVVASWAVREEREAGQLVVKPLGPRGLYRTWGLVRRANEAQTASQKGFINVCSSRFAQLLG